MPARYAVVLLAAASAARCAPAARPPEPVSAGARAGVPNTLTPAEQAAGWRLLFDGVSTKGWRGYNQQTMPDGWKAVDGALTRVGPGGDIVADEKLRDFELALQWKISPGGNSGVFYRGEEGSEFIYFSAPEMQVLDDSGHADGKSELTSAGAAYGLYPAPRGVVRPVGQWNDARILVRGNHVEHWLNGRKIVEYELGGPDWSRRVADSKFKAWPQYGKAAEGFVGLQDHGNWVAFRSIKLRVIR